MYELLIGMECEFKLLDGISVKGAIVDAHTNEDDSADLEIGIWKSSGEIDQLYSITGVRPSEWISSNGVIEATGDFAISKIDLNTKDFE